MTGRPDSKEITQLITTQLVQIIEDVETGTAVQVTPREFWRGVTEAFLTKYTAESKTPRPPQPMGLQSSFLD